MSNEQTLGEYIEKNREKKGLTQLELSEIIGVSQAAIGQWERGVFVPRPTRLSKLAEVLDVPYQKIKDLAELALKNAPNKEQLDEISEESESIFLPNNTINVISGFDLIAKVTDALRKNLLNPEQIHMLGSIIKTFEKDNHK